MKYILSFDIRYNNLSKKYICIISWCSKLFSCALVLIFIFKFSASNTTLTPPNTCLYHLRH